MTNAWGQNPEAAEDEDGEEFGEARDEETYPDPDMDMRPSEEPVDEVVEAPADENLNQELDALSWQLRILQSLGIKLTMHAIMLQHVPPQDPAILNCPGML